MSSRLVACLLLMVVFAAWKLPTASSEQEPKTTNDIKWEYRVQRIDANSCTQENAVAETLNRFGRDGWELVSFGKGFPAIPKDAEGSLLIRPAATGPGAAVTPQTADSFKGTIEMKMTLTPPGACMLIFKRLQPVPAKRPA